MTRLSPDELADLKDQHPIEQMIAARGRLGRANSRGILAGPCLCAPVRGKSPLWVNPARQSWGCLKGGCGGDLFSFLEQFDGLAFKAAIESLCGGETRRDPAAIERLRAERALRDEQRARQEAALSEAQRQRVFAIWQTATAGGGTLVDEYFLWRGLAPLASKSLRFSPDEPFYEIAEAEGGRPPILHRGPAMVAMIARPDDSFGGVHLTWLDPRLGTPQMPAGASGKAAIARPDGAPANPKKMRGVKQGGAIRLNEPPRSAGRIVLLIGEGIETTATALHACHAYGPPGEAYVGWAAGDLGNLCGGGLGPSTPHPGRPGRWIPSEHPDPDAPGILPPEWADLTVILGDGDSDPLPTTARLERARRRFVAAGRAAIVAMAPRDCDFNDMLREATTQ